MNRKLLLIARTSCESLEKLKKIHAHALVSGLLPIQQSLACEFVDSYARFGRPQDSTKVFHHIRNPDAVSWTSLINLCLRTKKHAQAVCLFSQLIRSGLRPDSYSVVAALCACGRGTSLRCGKSVHGMVFRLHLCSHRMVGNAVIDMYGRNGEMGAARLAFQLMDVKDVASWNSLLNAFVRCNDLEAARHVFDKMPQRNEISWNAMINGCVQGKAPILAFQLFREMRMQEKVRPSTITMVALLAGCADIGALALGLSVHCYIIKSNNQSSNLACATLSNALIDMYSKSGSLEVATKIFTGMGVRDVFSWTSMVNAYSYHGKADEALEVFCSMLKSGVRPNEVTFLSALSACSHAGLIAEGQRLFSDMVECYGMRPRIEHYGCMVDLLGRAGLLEEAKSLIEGMPVSADAVIWRALLNGCLLNGKFDLAEVAGKRVFELEPEDDGAYVLLWNAHSAANRQEEALKMRKLMRKHKLQKNPGCSWVEVDGIVQEFLAVDKPHHFGKQLFWILQRFNQPVELDALFS